MVTWQTGLRLKFCWVEKVKLKARVLTVGPGRSAGLDRFMTKF